jgi:hypothetical protein
MFLRLRVRLKPVLLTLVRQPEEGIGLAIGHRPGQASVLPDNPILLLNPISIAGPGLEEDVVIKLVQLGFQDSTPVSVLI